MNRRKPAAFAATRALKPALMAGGMIAVVTALPLLGAGSAQSTLTNMLAQGGMRGPAMFLLLATFLTAIGLPRQIPAFVAGYAFGPWYGTAIALVSQVLACSLDFIWARAIGQDFVRRRFGKVLAKIDTTLCAQPFIATLTLRLLPVGSNILLKSRRRPFLGARLPVPAGFDHRLSAADRDVRSVRSGQCAKPRPYAPARRRDVRGLRLSWPDFAAPPAHPRHVKKDYFL